jgi:hypothetical protein
MTTDIRYGVFVEGLGYNLYTSSQKNEKFVDDPAKAVRSGSYSDTLQAKQWLDTISMKHPTAQMVQYEVTVSAKVINPPEYDVLFKAATDEYNGLKAKYESMNAMEVEKVPLTEWDHYKALEHQLKSVSLI